MISSETDSHSTIIGMQPQNFTYTLGNMPIIPGIIFFSLPCSHFWCKCSWETE